jgi:hypothetical protein
MVLKHARRTGHAFFGCSGFMRHRCRFVRPAAKQPGRPAAPKYLLEVSAEMETSTAFRLTANPRVALAGLLVDVGIWHPARSDNVDSGTRRTSVSAEDGDVAWTAREDGKEGAVLPLHRYADVRQRLLRLPAVIFEGIPSYTLRAFGRARDAVVSAREAGVSAETLSTGEIWSRLPPLMRRRLSAYQLQGIEFVCSRGGRALIADEMGLGKSVQALGAAVCLQGWPLFIICPATMRLVWAEECERWMPQVPVHEKHIIFSSADKLPRASPKIVIASYKMVHRLRADLLRRAWGMVIVDESHVLRTPLSRAEARQTCAITQLLRGVARVVLLSGTPSPTRPLDLFLQCDILRPGLLGNDKYEFIKAYCHIEKKMAPFFTVGRGKRAHELNLLLREHVMIRRLKRDVMSELPPKTRSLVHILIHTPSKTRSKASHRHSGSGGGGDAANGDGEEASEDLEAPGGSVFANTELELEEVEEGVGGGVGPGGWKVEEEGVKTVYEQVALAKLPSVLQWLAVLMRTAGHGEKVVVFAHHRRVINALHKWALDAQVPLVRLDGSTSQHLRLLRLREFRDSSQVRLALVSVTAGGQGVDLSAASVAVFVELPPDIGWCRQAEDRLHRRGQRGSVWCYYLVARALSYNADDEDVALYDERRWEALNLDLEDVSSVTDGTANVSRLDVNAEVSWCDEAGRRELAARDHTRNGNRMSSLSPDFTRNGNGSFAPAVTGLRSVSIMKHAQDGIFLEGGAANVYGRDAGKGHLGEGRAGTEGAGGEGLAGAQVAGRASQNAEAGEVSTSALGGEGWGKGGEGGGAEPEGAPEAGRVGGGLVEVVTLVEKPYI